MVKNEGDVLKKAMVSTPLREYYNVKNPEDHNIYEVADRQRTMVQHEVFKETLRNFGVDVVDIEELPGHPNSVFTRDAALVTSEGYIKLRMGLKTREGEENWIGEALEERGIPLFGEIEPPGTVEGGDVILAGKVAFLSLSPRTNKEGAEQLSGLLKRIGYEVRVCHLKPPFFHIGSLMSMVGPETVLFCRGNFDKDYFRGFKTIEIDCGEYPGGNVLCLGKGEVVVSMSNRKAVEALYREKYIIHAVDLSEFEKGAGGPTCLVLPLERTPE